MHWSQARALTTIGQAGHLRLDRELDDALHRDQTMTKCVRCNGTGRIRRIVCSACHGTGRP